MSPGRRLIAGVRRRRILLMRLLMDTRLRWGHYLLVDWFLLAGLFVLFFFYFRGGFFAVAVDYFLCLYVCFFLLLWMLVHVFAWFADYGFAGHDLNV